MWANIAKYFFVYIVVLSAVKPMEIVPRATFTNPESTKSNLLKPPIEVFRSTENKSSSHKQSPYKTMVIIKDDDGDSEENVVCKHDKCVVSVDANIADKKSKGNKVSTDVHVIVSSDVGENKASKNPDVDSGEVPVFKGYNGVRYEDVNWNNPVEDEKPRNENEEPSSIIRSPYNGEEIIINPGAKPDTPTDRLTPPGVDWNRNYPNNNEPRDQRIPSGWTSNWKPSYPTMPEDRYHYNSYGDKKDFSGFAPTYRNVCKCTREPVYPGRADFYPKPPSNPWYPVETTTKQIVDDKLSPPFSVKQKRSYE